MERKKKKKMKTKKRTIKKKEKEVFPIEDRKEVKKEKIIESVKRELEQCEA